jgi:hypothetical protein
MSKGSAAPAPAASAPAPAASAQAPASAPSGVYAKGAPLVIEWNNDAQDGPQSGVNDAHVIDPETGKPEVVEPAKEEKAEPEETTEPKAAKPTNSERRRETLRALESEQKARKLEEALKTEQGERSKATAEAAKLRAAIKEGTLGDLLQERGMSAEEALEALLIGGDKAKPSKPAPKPEEAAIEELRAELKALKDERAADRKALEDSQKENGVRAEKEAIAAIQDMTKELDLPVTRAVDNGHQLILATAHQMWLNEGKTGQIADYVPDAAKAAESYWRKEKPGLAALADRATNGGNANARPEAPPSVSRRNGSRPDAKPKSLWARGNDGQMPSREEIDAQIKRELAFVDKV